jgi:hypothetical protein
MHKQPKCRYLTGVFYGTFQVQQEMQVYQMFRISCWFQIAFRATMLEHENALLRAQVITLKEEAQSLRHMLLQTKTEEVTHQQQRPT